LVVVIVVVVSVVTVLLFQGRLALIDVSVIKSVIGFSFGVHTCAPSIVWVA